MGHRLLPPREVRGPLEDHSRPLAVSSTKAGRQRHRLKPNSRGRLERMHRRERRTRTGGVRPAARWLPWLASLVLIALASEPARSQCTSDEQAELFAAAARPRRLLLAGGHARSMGAARLFAGPHRLRFPPRPPRAMDRTSPARTHRRRRPGRVRIRPCAERSRGLRRCTFLERRPRNRLRLCAR